MGLLSLFVRDGEIAQLKYEIQALREEKQRSKQELEELKLEKRLEQEEITHMVRINEEKNKQEVENEKIKLLREQTEKINEFRKVQTEELLKLHAELHVKMEQRFNTELGNLKEVYQALMQRLPNVTLALEKRLK